MHPERLEWMVVTGQYALGRGWLASAPAAPPPNMTAATALVALAKRSATQVAKGTAARPARRVPSTTEVVDRCLHLIEQELELQAGCEEDCHDNGPNTVCP